MLKSKVICFSDIDDTLTNSKRKLVGEAYLVGSVDLDGQPNCFMNQKQSILFNWLNETTELIAVTARSSRNFLNQVKLPFKSYVITSHGSVIFDENKEVLQSYKDLMISSYEKNKSSYTESMSNLKEYLKPFISCGKLKLSESLEYDIPLIPVIKICKGVDEVLLSHVLIKIRDAKIFSDELYYIHFNGNNLAFIPKFISKEIAVDYLLDNVLDNVENRPKIGLGDSVTDLGFMMKCDMAALPTKSQIESDLINF